MNPTVLIANHDVKEGAAMAAALGAHYEARAVSELPALLAAAESSAAVVLDTNFSEAQGVDVLMEVLTRAQLPVVMITPENDSSCVMEAMRCGAAGFLVKTATYIDLLPTALLDAIQKTRNNEALKQELIELRKRNAVLAKELKHARLRTLLKIPNNHVDANDPEHLMEEAIAERIKSGTLQLPSYPRVASKLRDMLQQDVGIAEVARLLSQDAAVSAKLLRVANSAQYGNLRPVESVEGAVSRLGLSNACNLAEMVSNRSLYSTRNPAYRALLDDLWLHSVAVAHACVAIARQVGRGNAQHLFSLGLLHDAGRLALMQAIAQTDPEGKLVEGEGNVKRFFAFLRKHQISCGVVLVQRWGFDQDFLDAVRYNYDLAGAEKPSRTVMIVHLANTLARSVGYGNPLDKADELDKSPAKGFLFPGDSDLSQIVDEVHRAIEQTRNMLA